MIIWGVDLTYSALKKNKLKKPKPTPNLKIKIAIPRRF